MKISRSQLLRWATGLGAAAALSTTALADTYPSRPITLIVPFPAGGATDVQARALANAAAAALGGQIVVLNQPGVSGTLGPATMARQAAPDGYTLSIAPGTLQRQPHLQKVNYDPLKDFTYIANVTAYTHGITVGKDAPWKTVQALLADAKARPGQITYGTVGKGSTANIAMERLARAAGVQFNFVPFKGASEVFGALAGGHLDVSAEAGFGSMVDGGRARLLATFNDARLKHRPDVPILKDLGIDVVMNGSYGIVGPKGMDPQRVQQIEAAFHKAMSDATFQRTLEQNDQVTVYMDSKTYTAWAARTFADEKRFLSDLGIKLE